ncbi:MAG TPA: PQQ-dependent sugar dehydrogenase [Pseudoxanthomonas sp.]|nr:PQQ-dependent sugar dehydrogenase [Pseudoxanthomonas sp.]
MTTSRGLGAGTVGMMALLLAACGGGGGGGGSGGGGPTPPPANRAPVFTSATTASVAENTAGTFYTATATDADGNALAFSLSGGTDRVRFQITAAGALSFVAAPDFEAPADANGDNVYQVELSVSDGTASVARMVTVTVTDVADTPNRAPAFTSAATASVAENTAGVFYTATATDADGDTLTYSLSGGTDRARMQITAGGALSFVAPPDFETPADADGNNVYQVVVSVSDGTASATLALAVTVTNVSESTAYRVRRVATGFDQPVFVAGVPDGSGRVFVVERNGRIRLLNPATGAIASTPFLDLTGQIGVSGERGLLGFATAPDYASSHAFYVFVCATDGTIEIRRYRTQTGNPDRADTATADAILRVPHPDSGHNGGWIGFGNDNNLYIAIGDGGDAASPDDPQDPNMMLGKILRIDPSRDDFPADASRDYAIPAGNPYASGGGAPEVLLRGLRNPFRNGFDPATGNLWIGDVGEGEIEEVDLWRKTDGGLNYGWPILEGTRVNRGGSTTGLTPPVAEYPHGTGTTQGSTVIGGPVYQGPVSSLRGLYVFADFINPNVWTLPVSQVAQGTTLQASAFTVRNTDFAPDAGSFNNLVSFGTDTAGNLYLVDMDGEIFVLEPR